MKCLLVFIVKKRKKCRSTHFPDFLELIHYSTIRTVMTSPTLFQTNTSGIIRCLSTCTFLLPHPVFFHIITHSHTHAEAPELTCVCSPVNHKSWVKLSAQLNRLYLLAVSTTTGPQEFHRITTSMTYCLLLSTHTHSHIHT